jgi:TRAP-type mannitol/chloroaromatic compound transport system substrate-binding protein
MAHHLPPTAIPAKALDVWAKKIESSTNGRVKITIYPSESLAKGTEAYSATAGGVCDIAFVNNVYEPSKWSLNNIVNLASLPVPTDKRGHEIWNKLWEKYPQMQDCPV